MKSHRIIRLPYGPPLFIPILVQNVVDPAKADVGSLAHIHAAIAPSNTVMEG